MFPGNERHLALIRFFETGGDDRFHHVRLAGPRTDARTEVEAYMALYAEEDGTVSCPFVLMTPRKIAPRSAARYIAGLAVPPEDVETQYTQVQVLDESLIEGSAEYDRSMLSVAGLTIRDTNLPVAFVAYQKLVTGQRKVVLYYTKYIPAQVILGVLQRAALRVYDS